MSANRNIYIVGLTGGIASGKSEAAKFLEERGAHCIDADAIYRKLAVAGSPMLEQIEQVFGSSVILEDGELNRPALSELIFGNEDNKRLLDGVTHPAIQKAMMDEVEDAEKNGEMLVFLNVPLLFECGMDVLCDEVWLVSVEEDIQLDRLMSRDGCTEEQARARIASQMSLEEKTERATLIIDNNRSIEKMYGELNSAYSSLVKRVSRMDKE